MDALILVDLQNDFMPGGALAVAQGDDVVPTANALAEVFPCTVATQDWHPADHGSFVTAHDNVRVGDIINLAGVQQIVWPVHCVQGTHGAAFHAGLETTRIQKTFQKGTDSQVDSYSGFFDNDHKSATGLADYLRSKNVHQVFIAGLATDYCVKFTALDARRLGFTTFLIQDACRGVELQPGDGENALQAMREAGVEMVDTTTLLAR